MKKFFIMLLAALVIAVVNPTISDAKVMHDGAEVVKGQTGKMTFKKDIKVYKRNPNGTFDSLVVKRNNFFRTYDIEKYDGKTFYQMGQYRVQATDLVVFKEVPIEIRSSFYNNPTYIVITRDGINASKYYGSYFKQEGLWGISFKDTNNGQILKYCDSGDGTYEFCYEYPGTDLKIVETISRERGVRYELTGDAEGKGVPLKESKTERFMKKGSIVYSWYNEINGYIYVVDNLEGRHDNAVWLPMNLLKPVGDK